MSTKTALKAAKAAIDAQDYAEAITQASTVLESDKNNYFAKLFLGRAYDKQAKPDESAKAYNDATKIKPDDAQAWLGLQVLYEGQGSKYVDEYITVSLRLAQLYEAADDQHKCQTVVDKLLGFVKANGTKSQLKEAYETQTPTSPIYSFLEGRLPAPSLTYIRLAEITEEEEKEKINKEIGERRTRLGAKKDQVTAEVKREVFGKSQLEDIYQQIIDWTGDDEIRRQYEERLLQRAYDHLLVLHSDHKAEKRETVVKLAHDMVVIKHPFHLAWSLELEWANVEVIGDFDVHTLREYCAFFPSDGLAKVLKGYLGSEVSTLPPPPPPAAGIVDDSSDDEDLHGGGVTLMGPEDRLIVMGDGLEASKNSALAHRLMAEYYQHLEEHESTVETVRAGLKLHELERRKNGLAMQKSLDAFNTLLANALIYYQSPRNHAEAKTLFNSILSRKPLHTAALIGTGLILEEEESYPEAIDYLAKALKRDPQNARLGAELAWCRALNDELDRGLHELQEYLRLMNEKDPKQRDMRAETMYRIGKCQWDIDPTRSSRKDRSGPYAQFLACIKTNINYAPAYTMLGIYYESYAKDKKRARQCFQKAFDLSASEVLAAESLARSYADQGDWEIVEIIAQRVVDSGKVRPPPGSKRKGISWPYSALGVVQMNKQEYQQAIVSFLAALRISPDDYHSYIGLGESYHNSGRYNSSLRTFTFAEAPGENVPMRKTGDSWFAQYMLANVNRELMNFDEAIDSYRKVLKMRPQEFGVEIALLQTLLEKAWRSIETGFFGRAADSASAAIEIAASVIEHMPNAFNLWKAVADSCSVFAWVQERCEKFPTLKVADLLGRDFDTTKYEMFADVDGIDAKTLEELKSQDGLTASVYAAILAQKRAIASSAHDQHAQAVAWYNLGWTEHRAHVVLEQRPTTSTKPKKAPTRFLKASMRSFKRAIELEAGNAEFWNALGVVTTTLNPKVAQHSLIRSLHLNERNVKAWTNLGTLYLLQNDLELAHKAFGRAQSTDPEYAHAWIGEGIVALMYGDAKEALLHFTHAFEIADMSTAITKEAFATASLDAIMLAAAEVDNTKLTSTLELIRPLFALQQLSTLRINDSPLSHLQSLYQERTGDHETAIPLLVNLCAKLEEDYEAAESSGSLARFAQCKADLARHRLATQDYDNAIAEAETALDLTAEPLDPTIFDAAAQSKLRLSAHLTTGLAQYYTSNTTASITAFRSALQESSSNPDVVCTLAQVLWAKGTTEERAVAKDQLFACVDAHPGHVGCVLLLGVMAVLDDDEEAVDAIREELQAFRVGSGVSERDRERVERVLGVIASSSLSSSSASASQSNTAPIDPEIQTSILLHPWKLTPWSALAASKGAQDNEHAAQMALKAAERCLPPRGGVQAGELAEVLAGTGVVADALVGVWVAPWRGVVWEAVGERVARG